MEETLGKRIAANRKRLRITQDRLAEQLGVTAQAVSKWENDQSCPDITTLPRLAAVFGITTDELLGIAPKATPPAEAEVIPEESEPEGLHIQNDGWDFHWESGRWGRLGFALWVLLVGGLMLASALLDWGCGMWDILWPSGLLVFGLMNLLRHFTLFSLACCLLGCYSLVGNLGLLSIPMGKELLLPVFLLLFGLSLFTKALGAPKHSRFRFHRRGHGRKPQQHFTQDGSVFQCATSFGEDTHQVVLPLLTQGTAEVNFGSLTVDLVGCGEFAPGAALDASCNFGELTILVPRTCRVVMDKNSAFGNVDFSGHPDPEAAYALAVHADVNFGSMTVRYL